MDQKIVKGLNEIPEKEQVDIVLSRAKEHGWHIYYAILKKAQKDRKNFHLLTDNGIMLQRIEYQNCLKKNIVEWSMVQKDTNKRVNGDYGTVISLFVEEYAKTHQVVCL